MVDHVPIDNEWDYYGDFVSVQIYEAILMEVLDH